MRPSQNVLATAVTANPERPLIAEIAPHELQSPETRAIYAIWNERRGSRAMPSRAEVLPRPLARFLRHISLMRVLPDTDDCEFRIIGDAHVQAYGTNAQGQKVSDVIAASPEFGHVLKWSYDLVLARRAPVSYRGFMGREVTRARFDWLETIYLPLGNAAGEIEDVMNASVYAPRDGVWPV